MANVYQVNIEGNVEEVTTIAEVKSLLGDTKVTKKAIEAGEYPMVVIAEEPTLDLETSTVDPNVAEGESSGTDMEDYTNSIDEATATDEDTEDDVTTDEVDAEDEVTTDGDTEDDVDDADSELEVKPTAPPEYLVGATAVLSDDSQNEEFIEWLFESDVDEVVIQTIDSKGNVEIKGYEGTVHWTDLTVTAPPKTPKSKTKATDVNPDVDGYPEVGYFADESAIKKYIKKLTNEQLYEWCKLEGAEYNEHDNPSINRMRAAMAIKAKHFTHLAPGNGKSKSKKKSKYADYSNEQLAQMAMDNDVEVKDAKGDARIERMYLIMALRSANIIE